MIKIGPVSALMAVVVVLLATLTLTACGQHLDNEEEKSRQPVSAEPKVELSTPGGYADGIYRGFYRRGDQEEVAVQFEMTDGCFKEIAFRTMRYQFGDYLADGATEIQKQIVQQYRQAADYLEGKGPQAAEELLMSKEMISDMDAVTGATLNTDKFVRAMRDGLERNVFKPVNSTTVILTGDYPDGVYKGTYEDGGVEQISVEVTVQKNRFVSITYNSLNYGQKDYLAEGGTGVTKDIADQYKEAAMYLEGRELSALSELYEPEGVVSDRDAVTGPTLRTNKLISAIHSALAAGPGEE